MQQPGSPRQVPRQASQALSLPLLLAVQAPLVEQTSPLGQLPHDPPHPSAPQVRPAQFGVQNPSQNPSAKLQS
jgi:hypothetical protein